MSSNGIRTCWFLGGCVHPPLRVERLLDEYERLMPQAWVTPSQG